MNIKITSAAIMVAAALLATGCGKQKPQSADTASVDSMVAAVIEAEQNDSVVAYDAAFFQGDNNYETTASGLKYVTVVEGTGAQPAATDMVTVHYTGRLLDGTVFDSSVSRGEPATFPLQQVIPGWTEGLQLMKEGGKTVFYIPSQLAYGEMGTPGGPIGPNADLIFEVDLIEIANPQ